MKHSSGFTLIELMIVIAIISIILAIAIPSLARSRMTANEATALASTRTVSTAEVQYQASVIFPDPNGMGWYGTIIQLGATTPPFVDAVLATQTKSGYIYAVTLVGQAIGIPAFQCVSTPINQFAGNKAFFVDDSGVLTFTQDGSVPTSASSPVQ